MNSETIKRNEGKFRFKKVHGESIDIEEQGEQRSYLCGECNYVISRRESRLRPAVPPASHYL
jgi:uncharacterized protein YlaI